MEYKFKTIKNENEITDCNMFHVDHYMWNRTMEPKTYGWAGYIDNKGFFIKMICEEQNPQITCLHHKDRVCNDSAMEVFFAFCEDGEELTNDVMYINFEINAAGAMFAKYGKGRHGRQFISDQMYEMSNCRAVVEKDQWSIEVLIPEEFLNEICDFQSFKNGKQFYCNFYKIAETKEIEHYASFSKIESEEPNFHLPVWFAKANIVK